MIDIDESLALWIFYTRCLIAMCYFSGPVNVGHRFDCLPCALNLVNGGHLEWFCGSIQQGPWSRKYDLWCFGFFYTFLILAFISSCAHCSWTYRAIKLVFDLVLTNDAISAARYCSQKLSFRQMKMRSEKIWSRWWCMVKFLRDETSQWSNCYILVWFQHLESLGSI